MAYAGHQFGHFNPQLGDGRAILLGEVIDRHGVRRDIQLKGSGATPFSRNGDGRAALGPVMREYIVSEAMHALGVPTTRALAMVSTGDRVQRETGLPGAILTRIANSHVRVGTFQYFAARQDFDAIRQLVTYVLDRLYPEREKTGIPALDLLNGVASRQARLIAHWMQLGFIHGVMNTDNSSVSGETIDYGPCAFLDEYDPAKVFSSIDAQGRYAYQNQPYIAQWNLARLAEAVLPLINDDHQKAADQAMVVIEGFHDQFQTHWLNGFRRKLGLDTAAAGDRELVQDLLDLMHVERADFTLTFRRLSQQQPPVDDMPWASGWLDKWQERLRGEASPEQSRDLMLASNPAVIPRNHQVEAAIQSATQSDDFALFEDLLAAVTDPFNSTHEGGMFAKPPLPDQRVTQTFCGT